ncbi:uncharacterized protein LOC142229893 [Haematobia irritans]|uniref:uncharacterized protein LOC142229893 n=1 Tax=Haematobia irritans TaxID=7368 RepID=UPI003F5044AA
MAPKSKILKFLTFVIFVWLFVILAMTVFNDGHSYYYQKLLKSLDYQIDQGNQSSSNVEKTQDHHQQQFPQNEGDPLDEDPYADYSYKEPSEEEIAVQLELKLPNIPFVYADRHKNRTMRKSLNCANFPALQTLKYYNNFWQTYTINNITFQLYGAYYDDRSDMGPSPVIRILGMINQLKSPFPQSYCQIWYEDQDSPQISAISEYKSIWSWGGSHMYFPYLLTCVPPKQTPGSIVRIPKAVAIVNRQCDTPTNILKVIYEKPPEGEEKLPFAVCVKGLDFPYADISNRLAEWLELQRLLGAEKVYMYDIAVHPNVKKLLTYYETEGFVEVRPITLVGGVVGLPYMQHWMLSVTRFNKRLNELIPYNDCFYRHMYQHDYIALIDVDEILMPLGELETWQDIVDQSLIEAAEQNCTQGYSAVCFRNTYVPYNPENFTFVSTTTNDREEEFKPAPAFMFFLNHPYRTSNYSRIGYAAKCLHQTSKVITLHNHYPVAWNNSCRPHNLNVTFGHMQHYHDFHPGKDFSELRQEFSMERFREPLIERTTQVLRYLGFVK